MKKLMSLFMATLLLVSMMPLALAQASLREEASDVVVDDTAESNTESDDADPAVVAAIEPVIVADPEPEPVVIDDPVDAPADSVPAPSPALGGPRGNTIPENVQEAAEDRMHETAGQVRDHVQARVFDFRGDHPDADPEFIRNHVAGLAEETIGKFTQISTARFRALARQGTDSLEQFGELDEGQVDKLAGLTRGRVAGLAQLSNEELAAELDSYEVRTVPVADLYRARALAPATIEAANAEHEAAIASYEEQKVAASEARANWETALGEGDETQSLEFAKEYLTHTADLVIDALNRVIAHIEGNDDLDETTAADMIEELEAHIEEMEAAKAVVEAAETKAELSEAGQEILSAWNKTKTRLKHHIYSGIQARVNELHVRGERLEIRIEEILQYLEDEGVDVAEVDELLDQFSDALEAGRENLKGAKDLFQEGSEAGDEALLEEGRELVGKAHDDLKEAHDHLREIVVVLAELGWDGSFIEDDAEVEVVVTE